MIINADLTDCVEPLIALHADVMICDPPYSDTVPDKAISAGTQGAPVKRDFGFAAITEYERAAIMIVAASVARWSAVFSDIESCHLWRDTRYVRSIPWIRWSQPQLSGDRPPSGCEMITLSHAPCAKHWNGPGSLTFFDSRSLRGANKFPCEKPLDLMLSLVSWFSDAGEMVIDPCAGSGTTGLAAKLLGRRYVLVERNPATCEIAEARLEAPLTDRDRERCARWVAMQRAWLHDAPDTAAGRARYARAEADTALLHGACE